MMSISIYSVVAPGNVDITWKISHFRGTLHILKLAEGILGKLCEYVFDTDEVNFGQLLVGMEKGDWIKIMQTGSDGQEIVSTWV
jgi:hypothetical protein